MSKGHRAIVLMLAVLLISMVVLFSIQSMDLRKAREAIQSIQEDLHPSPLPSVDLAERIVFDVNRPPRPFEGAAPEGWKKAVPCNILNGPRTMVLLALGQSNAANYGGRMSRSAYGSKVINYVDGQCFVAEDPLLGADGEGGSVWPELANRLIADGQYDKVVIVPYALGGTGMADWQRGKPLFLGLEKLIAILNQQGIAPTDVFWIQGETDRYPTSPFYENSAGYKASLGDIVDVVRRYAKPRIFVSLASSCPNQQITTGPTPSIRSAQAETIDPKAGIFKGADLDLIAGFEDRFNVCHLTASGLSKVADQLKDAVQQAAMR